MRWWFFISVIRTRFADQRQISFPLFLGLTPCTMICVRSFSSVRTTLTIHYSYDHQFDKWFPIVSKGEKQNKKRSLFPHRLQKCDGFIWITSLYFQSSVMASFTSSLFHWPFTFDRAIEFYADFWMVVFLSSDGIEAILLGQTLKVQPNELNLPVNFIFFVRVWRRLLSLDPNKTN